MKWLSLFLTLLMALSLQAQDSGKIIRPAEYIYDSSKEQELKAFVFSPAQNSDKISHPSMVIFHGGGWNSGEPSWAFGIAEKYASLGLVAIVAEYRLSDGMNTTPLNAMEDAGNIILWMRENAKELNIYPDSIAAYGWSAGAHLAACTAVFDSCHKKQIINSIPNALLLVSPALSITEDSWFIKLLLGKTDPVNCSPAENLHENMPPSIIVVGRDDTVTPLHESRLFHLNMLKYGNSSKLFIYDNVGHLFTPSDQPDNGYPHPDKEIQSKAYRELDNFLQDLGYIR